MASKRKKKKGGKKRQVNSRLLLIIGLCSMIVIGIGAGLFWLQMKGSVSRNLSAAQEYLAQGEPGSAIVHFGRVLHKEPTNQEAHEGRIAGLLQLKPVTIQTARTMYREYLTALVQHSQFTPADEGLAMSLLDEAYFAAANSDEEFFWQLLKSQSDEMRLRFASGTPVYNRATLMLGLSELRLGQSNLLGEVNQAGLVRFPGEDALDEYLTLEPDSDQGLAQLAFGRMAVARRLGLKELYQQEARNLEMAQATYGQALASNPEGPDTLLAVLRHLYIHELMASIRQESGRVKAIDSVMDELTGHLETAERIIAASDDLRRDQVFALARFLRLIDLTTGRERALAVLESWSHDNPLDLHAQLEIAQDRRILGELDIAETILQGVLDAPDFTNSFESYRQRIDRIVAANELFEVIDARIPNAEEDEIVGLIEQLEEVRNLVMSLSGGAEEDTRIGQLDGRIAFRENDFDLAARHFERVNSLDQTRLTAQSLRQAATSLENLGQTGLAAERLQQAIEREPRRLFSRLLLAGLYARMREPEQGLAVLHLIPDRVREANPEIGEMIDSLVAMQASSHATHVDLSAIDDPVLQAIAQADHLILEGKIDEAKGMLESMLSAHPEDIRLYVSQAFIAAQAEELDDAQMFIERALAIEPDNPRLQELLVRLTVTDPLERLEYVLDEQYPNRDDRMLGQYIGLRVVARMNEAAAEAARREGRDDDAQLADDVVRRAQARLDDMDVDLTKHSATNASAFAFLFEECLTDGRFAEAEEMLVDARENNLDGAEGALAESRLHLAVARQAELDGEDDAATQSLEAAAAAARRASTATPWRTAAWEALAAASVRMNNFADARMALEQLLTRAPGDINALQQLAAIHLQEGGDPTQAVSLLSDASNKLPGRDDLREMWLQIEAAHGSPAVALAQRHKRWRAVPQDRKNALWYAGLMAAAEPDFTMLINDEGQRTMSGRAWLALDGAQQAAVLDDLKADWLARIDTILAGMDETGHETLRDTILHATVLREAGRRDDMRVLLEQYLDGRTESDTFSMEVIRAAQFLASSDRGWEATNLLKKHEHRQSEDGQELSVALGAMYHAVQDCEQALPYLMSVEDAASVRQARLRAIDCLMQLGRLDEAKVELDTLRAQAEDYDVMLLVAAHAKQAGLLAAALGDGAGAAEARTHFRDALEQASQLDPSRARPYAELVESLVSEYKTTLDRAVLEEALRYAEAAESLVPDSEDLVIQRAGVLEAMGSPRQAVLDLESFLRKYPASRDVRSRLISAYGSAGTPLRAIDTIEEAIKTNPRDPYWHGMLGDHLRLTGGDLDQATKSYATAWGIEPTRSRLSALTETTRTTRAWDYQAVVAAIAEHRSHLGEDPNVRGLLARAEAGQGLSSRARETLREAFQQHQSMIAAGRMPSESLQARFEDLYVLFPTGDPAAAMTLVDDIYQGERPIEARRGLATYFALRSTPEDLENAVSHQRAVVDAVPDLAGGRDLGLLGNYLLMSGNNTEAAEVFKAIVDLRPDDPVALNNYAYLVATYLDGADMAEPFALRAVEIRSSEPSFLDTLAHVQALLGKHPQATTTRLSQLRIQPNNTDLMMDIALGYCDHMDKASEGLVYAEQALKLQPRDARALDVAGWVAWSAGETAKGRDRVAQSLRRQPTAGAHLHMARIMAAEGKADEARNHLKNAANLAQDERLHESIKQARADLDGAT